MMDRLRPYPDYKDSGLPWLGKVPAHWEVRRCKYLFREIDKRSATGKETHLSMSQKRGLVPSAGLAAKSLQSENYIGGKLCESNDLVLNRLKAHLGVFARARQRGIVSPDYTVLRPIRDGDVAYFESVFKTPSCTAELRRSTKGIVEGFWRLYTDDFYNVRVPVPPPAERSTITRYISAADARVRKFIRNRRRLIEVLHEQKQAIINQAVTRGLDPAAPLKPSGVDWLGDIPAHWTRRRLRHLADVRLSSVDKVIETGEIPVRLCNYVDVYHNDVIVDDLDFMRGSATAAEVDAFSLRMGDVLITKDSEEWQDIAVPAFVPETLDGIVCGYHLALVRPRAGRIDGAYLARAFTADAIAVQFRLAANGVTRYGLPQTAIKGALFPVPPAGEQLEIAEHIDRESQRIDTIASVIEKQIEHTHEYRTRLISDIVTGKLDVRHLAPAGASGDADEPPPFDLDATLDDEPAEDEMAEEVADDND